MSIFTFDDKFEVATDEISLWERVLMLFCDETELKSSEIQKKVL